MSDSLDKTEMPDGAFKFKWLISPAIWKTFSRQGFQWLHAQWNVVTGPSGTLIHKTHTQEAQYFSGHQRHKVYDFHYIWKNDFTFLSHLCGSMKSVLMFHIKRKPQCLIIVIKCINVHTRVQIRLWTST